MESTQGFRSTSLRVRWFRISKLRWWFITALFLQVTFYILQFLVFRAEAGSSTTFIVLLVMGGLIIGIQLDNYRSYQRKRNPASWHRRVLFIPSIVCVANTFVFFTGLFSMLFKATGRGVWEDAIPNLPPVSLAVFITTLVLIIPFIVVYALLSIMHYEFIVSPMKLAEHGEEEEGHTDDQPAELDNQEDDLLSVVSEAAYVPPSAPRMRLLFVIGMILQLIYYIMFLVSFEASGGNSTTFVVILVAGCSVFVIQLYVARGYILMIVSPSWHADRLFMPTIVIWLVSCCFFAGNFTLLFKAANLGLWEDVIPKLSPLGLTVFIMSIITYVPLLIIESIMGHLHFRAIAGKLQRQFGVELVTPVERFVRPREEPRAGEEEEEEPAAPGSGPQPGSGDEETGV